MHLIQKVKRKIRRTSTSCNDNESLLAKKGRKSKKKNPFHEDQYSSCSITASMSSSSSYTSASYLFDELDNEYNFEKDSVHSRSRSFNSIKGLSLSYSPLKGKSSNETNCDGIIQEQTDNLEEFAIVPYENESTNIIQVTNEQNDSTIESSSSPSTNNLPASDQHAIELHSKLEVVSDFDRFVSFFSDTISNLCESPTVGSTSTSTIQNTASSFFNFSSPDILTSQETQIVQHKSPKIPSRPVDVDALADENGLVHIFHDRLSTLYENPTETEAIIEEKEIKCSTLEDEDIIKARWAYAVEMMTLDKQCGSFNDIYEVAEI